MSFSLHVLNKNAGLVLTEERMKRDSVNGIFFISLNVGKEMEGMEK